MPVIEVCVEDVDGIRAAHAAGADRAELCVNLEVGGLTPPDELISEALTFITGTASPFSLRILVRDYWESFIHTQAQQDFLVAEVKRLRAKFVDTTVPIGFVVGALDYNGEVPTEFVNRMREAAGGCTLVFHRGIDACTNRADALNKLVDAGFNAILTAGGHESVANCAQMRADKEQTEGKLIIIASGGVRERNAAQILKESGASEIHFRAPYADGKPGTDPHLVVRIVDALKNA